MTSPRDLPSSLVYSSYLGGTGDDGGQVLVGASGANVVVLISTDPASVAPDVPHRAVGPGGAEDVVVIGLDQNHRPSWVTSIGGSGDDESWSSTLDASGATYISGITASKDLPITPNAVQKRYGGGDYDAMVLKVTPNGAGLAFATYLGGRGSEDGTKSVAVDAQGNAYVSGSTSSADFPVTRDARQPRLAGGDGQLIPKGVEKDAFLAKIEPSGTRLLYSTFLGGTGDETIRGPAFDSHGDMVVAGTTTSTDFPVSADAVQPRNHGGPASLPQSDGWVMKMSASGKMLWATYLGSTKFDSFHAIDIGPTGDVYVAGTTCGAFPVTAYAFQPTSGGSCDHDLVRFDSRRGRVVWASYLGGPGDELMSDGRIAVLPDGRVAMKAADYTDGFPTTSGAVRATGDGDESIADLTLTVISADGEHVDYATYLGGSGDEDDWGSRPIIAPDGSLWVSGVTWSKDIAVTPDAAQPGNAGGADALVEQFRFPPP